MSNLSGPWQQPPRSTPITGPGQPAGPQMPPSPVPQMQVPQYQPPTADAPKRRRRSGGLVLLLIVLLVVGGIVGLSLWIVGKAKDEVGDAIRSANDTPEQVLSDSDRTALGLTGGERRGFEGAAPERLAAAIDQAAPGQPTMFTSLSFYTDYAFGTAQDPTTPNRLDEYQWRDGAVGSPAPQANDDEAPTKVFTTAEVDWAGVARAMADVVRLAGVEDGTVSYLSVTRDTFTDGAPVVVRVYVNGPRENAVVVLAADGTYVETF